MSQINMSSNSLAKETLATGSGTPISSAPAVSTNQPVKFVIQSGGNAFEGDDMTDAAAPGDMMSGMAPGIGESGGIAHFVGKTLPVISH